MPWGERVRLPDTRSSVTKKIELAGHDLYVTISFYDLEPGGLPVEPWHPGEVFVKVSKVGSNLGGMCDCLGAMISTALQYGASHETICDKLSDSRFEPSSLEHTSLADAVATAIRGAVRERREMYAEPQRFEP